MLRILFVLMLVLIPVGLLAACGGDGAGPKAEATWQRDCDGKPSPPIGDVTLHIVERLGPDRVVVEARWTRAPDGVEGEVELVLPDGAWLVEGKSLLERASTRSAGVRRWTVGHRVGERLDAVCRLRADTPTQRRAREICVRLAAPAGE